jgi:26S proteasome regulatory subunit N9
VPRFCQPGNPALMNLYRDFVSEFRQRISSLELAKIAVAAQRTLADANEAFAFLSELTDSLKDSEMEAQAYCSAELAVLRVRLGDTEGALEYAEKAHTIMDDLEGIDADVNALYHKAMAVYYQSEGKYAQFYRSSLLMLLFTPPEDMDAANRVTLAYDMCLAVLVASDIVNFGELLAHPILESLRADGERKWMADIVTAVNGGKREEFEALLTTNRAAIDGEPGLASNLDGVREKISLLALVELLFTRTSDERTVTLGEVATACAIPQDQVEMLVMRAMALELIKGSIDEVAGSVTVTWVQPRVLDLEQIAQLRDRLSEWKENVKNVVNFVRATSTTTDFVA